MVNASSLVIQGLSMAGFRLRAGLPALSKILLGYLIACEILVILFTVVWPHMGLRMVVIPYAGAFMSMHIIWVLAKIPQAIINKASLNFNIVLKVLMVNK